MINLTVNERFAYVEIEVFGAYDAAKTAEIISAMRGLAERHGRFSEIEVHHGKVTNVLAAFRIAAKQNPDENFEFMAKLHKYALVADNPGWMFRLALAFGNLGKAQLRLFPLHERDRARAWIERDES